MDRNKPAITHWEEDENFRYNLFLILKISQITQVKKKIGFFVEMSDFNGARTPVQCRSHHVKKLQNLSKKTGIKDKAVLQVLNLKKFYKKSYTDRRSGPKNLIDELQHHLQAKINQETTYQERYLNYYQRVNELVESFRVQIGQLIQSQQKKSQSDFIDSIFWDEE